MSFDPQKVIAIARAEVDYIEKQTHDQLDDKTANPGDKNHTKYAAELAKIPFFNGSKCGVAWCASFVCWCNVKAYGVDNARRLLCQPANAKDNCAAGCNSAMKYYKSKGRFFSDPEPGDQIFFWNSARTEASHTGIVVAVDKAYVYTIEGNTSGASGVVANGGMVCEKKYALGYGRIAGYGSPDWGADQEEESGGNTPAPEKELTTLYKATVTSTGRHLNLRSKKSKQSAIVDTMPRGSVVDVLDDSDPSWWKVSYNGKTGYAMTKSGNDVYLTRADSEDGGSVTITIDKSVASALSEALRKAVGG